MSESAAAPQASVTQAPVNAVVAMIQVADVERSARFYSLLGFRIGNYVPREAPMHWAWLYQPQAPNWKTGANLMLTRDCRPNPQGKEGPQVLFYLYAADLAGTREQLIAAGIKVGDIQYPEYLPKGECQTHDPDGYPLMIAQSFEESP